MDGAGDFAAAEAGSDFETFGGGDAEHGVGEHGFHFVEAGLAEADGCVADDAGDGAAYAVFSVAVVGDEIGHARGGFLVRAADGEEGVDVVASDFAEEVEVDRVGGCGGMGWGGGEEVFAADGGDKGDDFDTVG